MATEEEIDQIIEEGIEKLDDLISNTNRFSIEESLSFWDGVTSEIRTRVQAANEDLEAQAEAMMDDDEEDDDEDENDED